ncbi:MAG: hypothetical protein QM730_05300 [Anaerolineales bacterium]
MQKSRHIAHSIIFALLSLFIPIVVLAFEEFFAAFRFSNEFKLSIFLLTITGIICGSPILRNSKAIKSAFAVVVKAMSIIGVLVNIGLLYFAWIAQPPEMTGTISSIYSSPILGYERSLRIHVDLPADELVERNLDPQEPVFIVNITTDTLVYEQVSEGQKRIVNYSRLRENQHINVVWNGFIFITDPAQVIALKIVILDQ